jgi:tetratricopeptide (TPR) repeat protein
MKFGKFVTAAVNSTRNKVCTVTSRAAPVALMFSFAWLTGCSRSLDPAAIEQFQRAQDAFDQARSQEDFLRVAALYDQMVASGLRSGAVFYNQGNAYARAGERGRAIASYRQALRYRPRDAQLAANLQFVRGANAAEPERPLVEYILFWQDWISYPEKFRAVFACAAVALGFGVVGVFAAAQSWRWLAVAALCVTLVLGLSALYDWYRFEQLKHGVVVRNDVVARKGDAETYEAAFTTPLAEGTEFGVLEQRRDWLRVQLTAATVGWVKVDDVVVY